MVAPVSITLQRGLKQDDAEKFARLALGETAPDWELRRMKSGLTSPTQITICRPLDIKAAKAIARLTLGPADSEKNVMRQGLKILDLQQGKPGHL